MIVHKKGCHYNKGSVIIDFPRHAEGILSPESGTYRVITAQISRKTILVKQPFIPTKRKIVLLTNKENRNFRLKTTEHVLIKYILNWKTIHAI